MRILLLLTSVFLAGACFAQDQTIQRDKQKIKMGFDSTRKASVLVIPFETKMYMSQIDQQICNRHRIGFNELVDKMRLNLADIIAFKLEECMPAYSLYKPKSDSLMQQLHYTYTSVMYAYRKLENPEVNTNPVKKDSSRILPQLKFPQKKNMEKAKTENGGSRIENGQIVSEKESAEKFMDVDVINPNLLNELSAIYNSTCFVFINQLDLLYSPESADQIRIKVHYSIIALSGKKQYSGASVCYMPSHISDLSEIKNDYFFRIATDVTNKFRTVLKTP